MSYDPHPILTLTPHNGGPTVLDLRALMTDASGPTMARLRYRPETEQRVNVNKELVPSHRGLRPDVRLRFDIVTNADQAHLAAIVSALARPRDVIVSLSLDGGTTDRPVRLRDIAGPAWLGGKSHVGARYELRLEATSPLDDWPEIGGMADGGAW